MPGQLDPHGRELAALRSLGAGTRGRMIEIGCGDGRLAFRLRGLPSRVTGVDPVLGSVSAAAAASAGSMPFVVAGGQHLPFRNGDFDQAVFGWSL